MIPVESRTLTIPTHHGHAFRVMNELRVREELCDISINVDGRHFHAHRVVLAGCSPYLRAMFTNGMLESEKSVVTIRGIDQETMLVLLDFMYTGTVCVSTDNVQALLQAASMLHLAGLRTYCSQFLQVHIDPGNCLGKNVIRANTKHLYNICTTSAQRLRLWSNIVQKLYKCFVFARMVMYLFSLTG